MLNRILEIKSLFVFTKKLSLFLFFYFFIILAPAFSLPLTDTYTVTSRNFVDNLQNSLALFDNSNSVLNSAQNLTRIKETTMPYSGVPSGIQVTKAGGDITNITSWSEDGYIIEFCVSSSDGKFISFSPFKTDWGLKIEDLDLVPAEGAVPEIIGIYFDFTSSFQELLYNLDPLLLSSVPIGVGKHPYENHDVVYATDTGSALTNHALSAVINNKLQLNLDSLIQFESFSLESIVKALGVSSNFNQSPIVDKLKIGLLIKGISVDRHILLPGDFNCDLTVDAADYSVWRDNLGLTNAGPCTGDADGDRDVDAADYLLWKTSYGTVYQPPPPPPATVIINNPAKSIQATPVNDIANVVIDNPPAEKVASIVSPETIHNTTLADSNQSVQTGLESAPKDAVTPSGDKKKKPKNKNKKQKKQKKKNKNNNKKVVDIKKSIS